MLEDIKKGLWASLQTAGIKTAEYTRIGKIKIDIFALKKEIEDKFLELGGRVYHLMAEEKRLDVEKDVNVIRVINELKELESELGRYNQELENVKHKSENGPS